MRYKGFVKKVFITVIYNTRKNLASKYFLRTSSINCKVRTNNDTIIRQFSVATSVNNSKIGTLRGTVPIGQSYTCPEVESFHQSSCQEDFA